MEHTHRVTVFGGHNSFGCRLVMTVDEAMNVNETKQRPRSVGRPSYRPLASAVISVPVERLGYLYTRATTL